MSERVSEEIDERPEVPVEAEPIPVAQFEGEFVRQMSGKLPAVNLEMPEGYARGTHLTLAIEVRVRNVRYEEITRGPNKGDLVREHVFALEEVQLTGARSADQADPGVGGSAAGARITQVFPDEPIDGVRECYFDADELEVVHQGGCELCRDRVEIQPPVSIHDWSGQRDVGF